MPTSEPWKTAPAPAEPPTIWQVVRAAKKGEIVKLVPSLRRAYFMEAIAHENLYINQRVIVVENEEASDAD